MGHGVICSNKECNHLLSQHYYSTKRGISFLVSNAIARTINKVVTLRIKIGEEHRA